MKLFADTINGTCMIKSFEDVKDFGPVEYVDPKFFCNSKDMEENDLWMTEIKSLRALINLHKEYGIRRF